MAITVSTQRMAVHAATKADPATGACPVICPRVASRVL
jgi:hypothetical protein